ncbi:MAG: Ig-like domain-containing protein, partial [Thiotrichales bacterium]|nr:Ig-like domain-containing protein [Thiotrichales bacterium]
GNEIKVDAVLKDQYGNTSAKGTDSATVDTTATAGTVTINDVTSDNIINATESGQTIAVTGTATGGDISIGDTVTMTINGTDYTTTVGSDGSWSVNVAGSDLAADSDKGFTASVASTDVSGNPVTSTADHTYAVDIQAPDKPVITNITDTNGDYSNVILHGTGEPGATITLFSREGSTTGGNDTGSWTYTAVETGTPIVVDANGNWTVDVSNLPNTPIDDNEFFKATQTDVAGNVSADSDSVHYWHGDWSTVNTETQDDYVMMGGGNDTINIISNDSNDKFVVDGGNGTDKAVFSGKFSDYALSTSSTGSLMVTEGASTDSDGNGVGDVDELRNIEKVKFNDGTYDVSTGVFTLNGINVDIEHDTGTSSSDRITNDSTLKVTGLVAGATLEYSVDGGQTWTSQYNPQEGTNNISVRQVDAEGHTSESSNVSFTLDTQAGANIDVDKITGDGYLTAAEASPGVKVPVTGYVQGDAQPGDTISIILDGNVIGTGTVSSDVNSNGAYTFSVDVLGSDLADGSGIIPELKATVTGSDVAGNTFNAETTEVYMKDFVATVSINVTDGNASDTDNVISASEATSAVVSGNVEVGGQVNSITISDGTNTLTIPANQITVYSNGYYTVNADVSSLNDGTLTVSVEASDKLGNVGTNSTTIEKDTQAQAGAVTVDSITDDNIVNTAESGQTIAVTGTASGGDVSTGDAVTMTINGNQYATTVASDGSWSVNVNGSDLSADTDKSFTVSVASTDDAGNTVTSTATHSYSIDATPEAHDDGNVLSNNLFLGLQGEYYGVDTQLSSVEQFRSIVDSNTADATFKAQNIDYQQGSGDVSQGTHLQNFLGSDAASLSNDPGDTSDGGIHLYGSIYLAAGDYNFKVYADDGYQILIDGKPVAEVDGNQSPTSTTHDSFTVADSGYHSIDIVWWDQGGDYVFQPEISSDGGQTYSPLDNGTLLPETDMSGVYATQSGNEVEIATSSLLANDTDADQDSLSVTSVSNAAHGQVTLGNDGTVTFTPESGYVGVATFDYTISDGHGGTDTATVSVNVLPVDSKPVATDETQTIDFESSGVQQSTTNLVFTLDVSGSMRDDVSGSTQNRFEIAQDALVHTIQTYQAQGATEVNLTLFGGSGLNVGWMSASDAIDYIQSLDLKSSGIYAGTQQLNVSTNNTDYKDALDTTRGISFTGHSADKTVAYFLSDGEPNENQYYVNDDSDTTIQNWKSFVDSNVDELNVVGVGSNISDTYLDIVQVQDGKEALIVTDETQLADTLVNNITLSASGTVADNVTGGDGAITIQSIQVNGTSYTASDFPNTGVAIDGKGTLTFDFDTGNYTYTASSNEFTQDVTQSFSVTVADADGDTASVNVGVKVNVDDTASAPTLTLSIGSVEQVAVTQTYENTHTYNFNYCSETEVYNLGGTTNSATIGIDDYKDSHDEGKVILYRNGQIVDQFELDALTTGASNTAYSFGVTSSHEFDSIKIQSDSSGDFTITGVSAQVTPETVINSANNYWTNNETITGTSGNDIINVGSGDNKNVLAGSGDDTINMPTGWNNYGTDSVINGGSGSDTLFIDDAQQVAPTLLSNGYRYDVTANTDGTFTIEKMGYNNHSSWSLDQFKVTVDDVENIQFNNSSVTIGTSPSDSGNQFNYQYDLDASAALTDTDGSETLSDVKISGLPGDGSTSVIGTGVTDNGDGTYSVKLQDNGTMADDVKLSSSRELTSDELNDVHAAVTSTENNGGDTATTEVNASGDNFLYADTGDDLFVGTSHSDTFKVDGDGSTTVQNFDVQNDVLDLSDVIADDQVVTQDTLSQYLTVTQTDKGTEVTVDSNGKDVAGGEVANIMLEGLNDSNNLQIQIDDNKVDYND